MLLIKWLNNFCLLFKMGNFFCLSEQWKKIIKTKKYVLTFFKQNSMVFQIQAMWKLNFIQNGISLWVFFQHRMAVTIVDCKWLLLKKSYWIFFKVKIIRKNKISKVILKLITYVFFFSKTLKAYLAND